MKRSGSWGLKLFITFALAAPAHAFDCMELDLTPREQPTIAHDVSDDFALRDLMAQTDVSQSDWKSCCGSWGPCPQSFPAVIPPMTQTEAQLEWRQKRVIAAAKKWVGLPYRHFHIPAMGGLDCSNFTAWVYNFAFGIRFSSNIETQSKTAGRVVTKDETLQPGDLLYFWNQKHTTIEHVALFIDSQTIIDAVEPTIEVRPLDWGYLKDFAWARRVL